MVKVKMISAKPVGFRELGPVMEIEGEDMA